MTRPVAAHDAVSLVRRSGLVGESALARFLAGVPPDLPPDRALALLVSGGLLTRYQAAELAAGRGRGLRLGGYRVLAPLGRGGSGQVFLAEHAALRRRVAVKVLSAGPGADPDARRRVVREARAAAAIDHPNVVHVFDVDADHDPPFLVMEYVDGVSLQAAVARRGTLAGGEAAAVGVGVARGLAAAHAAGVVHRDVKPANLLVDRRGRVKVLDLGIVRFPGDDSLPPGADGADAAGVILGTLDYLAPEQAVDSSRVDARADLYALGATLYFALAGHPPFPGPDPRHNLAAKRFSDPPPVHRLRPDVDPALSGVVHTLLARDPAARPPTAAAAAAALAPFAAVPASFPDRLFRPDGPAAMTDSTPCGADPLPTRRILKAALLPPPPDAGPPTVRVTKVATEPAVAPLAGPPGPARRPAVFLLLSIATLVAVAAAVAAVW